MLDVVWSDILAVVVLTFVVTAGAMLLWSGRKLVNTVRERHRSVWISLGEPDFKIGSSIAGIRRMHSLVFSSKIESLTDPEVIRWRWMSRIALIVYYAAFVAFLVYFLATLGSHLI